jgi:pantoate--beta-alanine ligase
VTQHIRSLAAARPILRALRRGGGQIGSVHTLGALHEAHARVIHTSAAENDHTVVTIYPNKAQLAPGRRYVYDLERDVELAVRAGATHIVSSDDAEMYPPEHITFLDQGEQTRRLDGTIVPFLFRGMITMCIRWINFVRPDRTYWGLKDIGQALLVERAVRDLLIDTEVREVPCVRYRSGIPVSSRLMPLGPASLAEVASVYAALEAGRRLLAGGERRSGAVIEHIRGALRLEQFRLCYVKLAAAHDFTEPEQVPNESIILHVVITNGEINHFDGLLLRSDHDRSAGPPMIWLDQEWP